MGNNLQIISKTLKVDLGLVTYCQSNSPLSAPSIKVKGDVLRTLLRSLINVTIPEGGERRDKVAYVKKYASAYLWRLYCTDEELKRIYSAYIPVRHTNFSIHLTFGSPAIPILTSLRIADMVLDSYFKGRYREYLELIDKRFYSFLEFCTHEELAQLLDERDSNPKVKALSKNMAIWTIEESRFSDHATKRGTKSFLYGILDYRVPNKQIFSSRELYWWNIVQWRFYHEKEVVETLYTYNQHGKMAPAFCNSKFGAKLLQFLITRKDKTNF